MGNKKNLTRRIFLESFSLSEKDDEPKPKKKKKEEEDFGDDENTPIEKPEDEDDLDLELDDDDLDLDSDEFEFGDDSDLDIEFKDEEELDMELGDDDLNFDVSDDMGGLDDVGGEYNFEDGLGTIDDIPDMDDIISDDPPLRDQDMIDDIDLDDSCDFTEFVTNQLIDYPVTNVAFEEKDGAKYVDAKFGDITITFVLYLGEQGEPLLGMLHKVDMPEMFRVELPPEALCNDGRIKSKFMPIDWIRDNISRVIDTAPVFECYRIDFDRSNSVRKIEISESNISEENYLKISCPKCGCLITNKSLSQPKKARSNVVNDGMRKPDKHGEAKLGGSKLTAPSKSGGNTEMTGRN
jgi:hypothetical protein